MIAYFWASGLIEFGRKTPPGAIPIASGSSKPLRSLIEVCARHGYKDGVLLVPGVPEAKMMKWDPLKKAIAWKKWVIKDCAKLGLKPEFEMKEVVS